MTKKDEQLVDEELQPIDEVAAERTSQDEAATENVAAEAVAEEDTARKRRRSKELTTLQKMKKQVAEGDDAPTGSLRFRDIVGGDFLWMLVRHHVWLIILIGLITTSYIAVRYQCQQDVIDINQLERDLVDARFQALSSSSNLTRMSRQANVIEMLRQHNDTLLKVSSTPPFIIEVTSDK